MTTQLSGRQVASGQPVPIKLSNYFPNHGNNTATFRQIMLLLFLESVVTRVSVNREMIGRNKNIKDRGKGLLSKMRITVQKI